MWGNMGTYTKMRTFVTVVEENSFNRAATHLNTSGAEISRRISALEDDLKTKLINRTTRKLTLTKLGEIYYEDCKRILTLVQEANQKILSQQQEPTGELIIHYIASGDIIPKLGEFMQRYPSLILKLHRAERMPDFEREPFDITIGLSEHAPIPENCVRKKIGAVRNILVASPDYLARYKPIRKPADLCGHRYISHLARTNDKILEFNNGITIHLTPCLYMNDTEEMIKAAKENLGIVYIHEDRIGDALQRKELIEILPEYCRPAVNYFIVYQYDRYLEQKIRVLLDFFEG